MPTGAPASVPVATKPPISDGRPTTSATTRPSNVIKSAPASIDAIRAGTKTSTTRKGIRSYPIGPAVTTDGKRHVTIEITRIDPKRVGNLTAADAASDGSDSLAAYRATLVHSYPGLTDDDIVSVVHFRVR